MIVWLKESWFKIGVLIILSLLSWSYFKSTQIKQDEVSAKKLAIEENEVALNQCFTIAEDKMINSANYWKDWQNETCVDGAAGGGSSINKCLDAVISELNKAKVQEESDRAECLRIYPQ